MKIKYFIFRNNETNELIIRESGELEKEMESLLCEEAYDGQVIKSAIAKGKDTLIPLLRTQNMYPSSNYIDKIAESVISMYDSEGDQPVELFFDDLDYLAKEIPLPDPVAEIEKEATEIDELLDDADENLGEKSEIKNINSGIKVAEDDTIDTAEGS